MRYNTMVMTTRSIIMSEQLNAMKQWLEALEKSEPNKRKGDDDYCEIGWMEHREAIASLRTAIEQAFEAPMQKPVAWMYEVNGAHTVLDLFDQPDDAYDEGTLHPLYTTQQQHSHLLFQKA